MDILLLILAFWGLLLFVCWKLNRWAKRRGEHVVLDYDPSKPILHYEEPQL